LAPWLLGSLAPCKGTGPESQNLEERKKTFEQRST
jgi:hypothetical protein